MATEAGRTFTDYDPSLVPTILGEAAGVSRDLGFPGLNLVIIGGLAPHLLVPRLDDGIKPHVGTSDLDFCLRVALVKGTVGQYEQMDAALQRSGFTMIKKNGTPETWRWRRAGTINVTVEFLAPVVEGAAPGRLHRPGGPIAGKLSALMIASGDLIDRDSRESERTVDLPKNGGRITHKFLVAGPMSWIAAKVDALYGRSKNKDSYDLVWLIEAWPGGQPQLAKELKASPVWTDALASDALKRLGEAFSERASVGTVQYADFMQGTAERALLENQAMAAVKILISVLQR